MTKKQIKKVLVLLFTRIKIQDELVALQQKRLEIHIDSLEKRIQFLEDSLKCQ